MSSGGFRSGAQGIWLGVVLFAAGCNEPLAMFPGGALAGEPQPAPAEWANVRDLDTIQVEARPSEPYSINIWGVAVGPDLYIATGEDGTRWSGYLAEDPRVRVRIGDALYELTAMPVDDEAERSRVVDAYIEKYDVERGDNFIETGLIFRLDRRP